MKAVTWFDDPAHFRPSRRTAISVGALSCFGLTLDGFLRLQSANAGEDRASLKSKEGKAKSVIHIFLPGGMAHQDSFDPKPTAPLEYRGEIGVTKTKIDGVYLSEHMKSTAQVVDKIAICRSMTHGEAAHERGTHNMFTGYKPSPALIFPSFGTIVAHEFGVRNNLPPYICIPNMPTNFAGSGYLSSKFGPFSLGSDPANPGFRVQDLSLPNGVDDKRFSTRKSILETVNDHFATREKADNIAAMDTFYQQAYSLISSEKAKEAFDINKEDAKLRDTYGRNAAGQRMLMARRLVEAGVRFVTLTYGGWDMHNNIKDGMKSQLPEFDKAFAALITDLSQRGLLDSTLVMVSSEFGRTPKINATAGRDHWPKVFSVVLAGGGIKKGIVYGSSDPTATEPEDDPLTVEDLATTMYTCLGIPSEKVLIAPGSRPIDIVNGGKARKDLLA
ncbi:DUF1501 domain-containing protein [Telmatocola sphagniphila]|jgi:hypothetical protein|uniref:DUF1501 domain-containing protein n=1 Tax=Telmatocola sphagniphila TaxID=1123043 RepID=A0A8E6EZ20_9BACT|nr:DUF1501 domain-containing protein [Telmatocola sphagniphila]QVL32966.1 DUF1501 domain-containing protein [Telmatocola sphagniphila]